LMMRSSVCPSLRRAGSATPLKMACKVSRKGAKAPGVAARQASVPWMPSFRKSSVNSVPCGMQRFNPIQHTHSTRGCRIFFPPVRLRNALRPARLRRAPSLQGRERRHPSRRSHCSTVSSTGAPAAHSSGSVDSASFCEMPPAEGTKIIVVGGFPPKRWRR